MYMFMFDLALHEKLKMKKVSFLSYFIDVDSNIFAATVKDQLIENEIVPDETGDTSTQLLSAIPSTYMKNYNKV